MCSGGFYDSELLLLQYILNDKEVEVKTELWMKQNAEYLKEQKGQHNSSSPPSSSALYSHRIGSMCETLSGKNSQNSDFIFSQ